MLIRCRLTFCIVLCALPVRQGIAHGALEDELRRIDAVLKISPADAGGWFERSCLNLSYGEWRRAIFDVDQADRLAPGRYQAAFVRGQALAGAGELTAALAELNDFLKRHPEHTPARIVRARVLLKLNKAEEAFADFRVAITRSAAPEPDLYLEFADGLAAHGRQSDAVSVLQEGIEKLGGIPSLAGRLIDLEVTAGHFDAAIQRVEGLIKNSPRPEPWMARRADLLDAAGRKPDSVEAWQALSLRLAALPDQARRSHAMCLLSEQAARHVTPPKSRPLLIFPGTPSPAPNNSPKPAPAP